MLPNERCGWQALFGCGFAALVVQSLQLNRAVPIPMAMFARTALATSIFLGCVAAPPPAPVSPADPLAVHRLGWANSRPHSYAFTYRDQCFCQGSNLWVRIWVVGDTVARAELLPVQDPGISRSSAFRRPTIDSLFVWLSDAYNRKSDRIDVQYDPKYHFPSHANLDWRKNVIDDEMTFEVRDFAAVSSESDR